MANNKDLKQALAKKVNGNGNAVAERSNSLKGLLDSPVIKRRFEQILDKKAPQFMSSILNLVNSDDSLRDAEPMSVISAAMMAATLDLPINKNLGYAWIIAYKDRNRGGIPIAQFQMGYKGYIQLALRTGQYRAINAIEIREGELINWNPLTEVLEIDFTARKSDAVIGYAGYFELINGFKKTVYWTKQQIENHRIRFNKSRDKNALTGVWLTDYDSMALKTVIRNMLAKWGILSVEMQEAYSAEIESEIGELKDITDEVNLLNQQDFKVMEEGIEEFPEDESEVQNADTVTGEILEGFNEYENGQTELKI